MKLSTRTRYGVRLMLALACQYGEGPVFLRRVAEMEGMSENYLSQIIIPLRGRGLVNSIRGARGGYTLAKPPSSIRLLDIVELLEGGNHLVDCGQNETGCSQSTTCVVREVWLTLEHRIAEYLASITLAQLLDNRREKLENTFAANI